MGSKPTLRPWDVQEELNSLTRVVEYLKAAREEEKEFLPHFVDDAIKALEKLDKQAKAREAARYDGR